MVWNRLSHGGKVCSGDYIHQNVFDQKYSVFYMESEGQFLYNYIFVLASFFIGAGILILSTGSIMFLGGSFVAFKFIEDVMKNMDDMPGLFVEKDEDEEVKLPENFDEMGQPPTQEDLDKAAEEKLKDEFKKEK